MTAGSCYTRARKGGQPDLAVFTEWDIPDTITLFQYANRTYTCRYSRPTLRQADPIIDVQPQKKNRFHSTFSSSGCGLIVDWIWTQDCEIKGNMKHSRQLREIAKSRWGIINTKLGGINCPNGLLNSIRQSYRNTRGKGSGGRLQRQHHVSAEVPPLTIGKPIDICLVVVPGIVFYRGVTPSINIAGATCVYYHTVAVLSTMLLC